MLDQVDDPFLDALGASWADWPPLRKMVAAACGHKPKPPPSRDYAQLLGLLGTAPNVKLR